MQTALMKDLIHKSKWTSSSKTKPLDYNHYRSIGGNEDWVCSFWSSHGNAEFSLCGKLPNCVKVWWVRTKDILTTKTHADQIKFLLLFVNFYQDNFNSLFLPLRISNFEGKFFYLPSLGCFTWIIYLVNPCFRMWPWTK